jgi:hypothetical protein
MNNGHDLGPDAVKAHGNVEIAVGEMNGKVALKFFKPVDIVVFDPKNAVDIAKQFLDIAQACGANITLQVPKRKISKERRDLLINRAYHVYRSLTEKGRPPKYIAKEVVDSVLSAID